MTRFSVKWMAIRVTVPAVSGINLSTRATKKISTSDSGTMNFQLKFRIWSTRTRGNVPRIQS